MIRKRAHASTRVGRSVNDTQICDAEAETRHQDLCVNGKCFESSTRRGKLPTIDSSRSRSHRNLRTRSLGTRNLDSLGRRSLDSHRNRDTLRKLAQLARRAVACRGFPYRKRRTWLS
jgi:hypothetical protein